MARILITVFLIISFDTLVIAQENEKYINNQIINIETLIDKGEFVRGVIYLNNDTIEADLLTFNGKRKINYFLFCITRTQLDSIKIFKSNQIKGYKILDINYISYNSERSGFFLKQLKTGKIDLFEKCSLPDDHKFLYYLKSPNSVNYFIINPSENNVTEYQLPDNRNSASSGATSTYFQTKGINQKFKIFISIYLGDCDRVTNMVKTDFYTINDIPNIIESYNNCFK